MPRYYLNPKLVRPTGENARRQAERAGAADPALLTALAGELAADESLLFGEVVAHRLRALAARLARGDTGVAAPTVTPGEIDDLAERLDRLATHAGALPQADGAPAPVVGLSVDDAQRLARALRETGTKAVLAERDAQAWKDTAKSVSNLLDHERALALAQLDELRKLVEDLERDVERAERVVPGVEQHIVVVLTDDVTDSDAIGIELGMELALQLLTTEVE